MTSEKLHRTTWHADRFSPIIAGMSNETLGHTFIKAWRKHRELTQDQLADAIGITTASLSRIENGKQPYNQRQVEQIATVLRCSTGDLLSRDPSAKSADIVEIWDRISADKRDQARAVLQAFTDQKKA